MSKFLILEMEKQRPNKVNPKSQNEVYRDQGLYATSISAKISVRK